MNNVTFASFLKDFWILLDHLLHWEPAAKKLLTLWQGSRTVADFFIQFPIAAQETAWDKPALKSIVSNALSEILRLKTNFLLEMNQPI